MDILTDKQITARILQKLYMRGNRDASHTLFENVKKWFTHRDTGKRGAKRVDKIMMDLIKKGLIVSKPTGYGLEVSLNLGMRDDILKYVECLFTSQMHYTVHLFHEPWFQGIAIVYLVRNTTMDGSSGTGARVRAGGADVAVLLKGVINAQHEFASDGKWQGMEFTILAFKILLMPVLKIKPKPPLDVPMTDHVGSPVG